ncbi:protein PHLOEM PROTEIN 2-LIKE A9-like isoform X2 [Coffea arabica]|uniref:Protein PHLOEM PROTEIN 2-LIKE A9-like isoform X2 n=1 Tax=Coffea arabica TaxID=13443 RepID=A0ABM4VL74_COFAR
MRPIREAQTNSFFVKVFKILFDSKCPQVILIMKQILKLLVAPSDGKPAELLQVSWLEVAGSVDADPQKTYDVSFRVSLTPDAFGWGSYPIYIMVKRGKFGKFDWKKVYLTNCDGINRIHLTGKSVQNGRENQGSTDRKLYFGLYEVWSGKWKGGLKIHDVTIREV